MTPLKTRILSADDHALVRRGLRLVLEAEADLEVVAEAGDGAEAIRLADRDLVEACRAAMRGEAFLYPGAMTSLISDYLRQARDEPNVREDPLTPREQEVVKWRKMGPSPHVREPARSACSSHELDLCTVSLRRRSTSCSNYWGAHRR